jgi:dethiobiotin synthase
MSTSTSFGTPPRRGLFIVGTDTSVGKTTVACGLLRLAHRRRWPVRPYKPAETGWAGDGASDAARLRIASARLDLQLEDIAPVRLALPVSPGAAADAEGRELTVTDLLQPACRAAAHDRSAFIVEAAGGLLTPYAPGLTALDLARHMGLPILLVSRNVLGTVSQTTLALRELHRASAPLLGVLLVSTSPSFTPDQATNATWIKAGSGVRPLGPLPFLPEPHPDQAADALERLGFAEIIAPAVA